MQIVDLDRAALFEWADFIAEHNRECVASLYDRPDAMREYIANLVDGSFCACAARTNGQPIAIFIAEYDVGLQRTWLMGPVVADRDTATWLAAADALLDRTIRLLPAGVEHLQLFLDERARQHAEFALERGFVAKPYTNLSLRLTLSGVALSSDPAITALPRELQADFVALHELTFVNAYWTARQIIEHGDRRWLFIHRDADALDGYITGELSAAVREAYVDFVGVREDRRRMGIATALLTSAASVLQRHHGVESLRLTVRATNTAATSLYSKLGFQVLRSMRAFERPTSAR